MGFSTQEYWSGLWFPSPMHACMHAKLLQSCPTLCDAMNVRPYGQQPTRPLCPQDSLGKNTGVGGSHFLLQNDSHKKSTGTSLEVQSLKLCASTAGAWVWSLVRELRFWMLCGVAENKQINKLANVGKAVEKRENLYNVGRNVNWCSHCEKQYRAFF